MYILYNAVNKRPLDIAVGGRHCTNAAMRAPPAHPREIIVFCNILPDGNGQKVDGRNVASRQNHLPLCQNQNKKKTLLCFIRYIYHFYVVKGAGYESALPKTKTKLFKNFEIDQQKASGK